MTAKHPPNRQMPPAQTRLRPLWLGIALGAVLPLLALIVCRQLAIPLGCKGRFDYLYSPVSSFRLMAVPLAAMIGVVLGAGVWLAGSTTAARRRAGLLVVAVGAIALGLWTWFAPPFHFNQHVFNTHSMSHDGAFVDEALQIDDVAAYLHAFPQRARTPEHLMRGTRIISNPPGATLLALVAEDLLQVVPGLEEHITAPLDRIPGAENIRHSVAVGLMFFWLLITLWLLSAPLFYAVGRLYWPAAPSAACAALCVFTPATLLFTPGKDPAQLLTIALPLLLWLYAARRGVPWAGLLAGLALLAGVLLSLVHVWVAGVVLVASALSALGDRDARRRLLFCAFLPAAAGFCVGTALLYLLVDFDLLASVRAVAASQGEVTRGPDAMPLAWQLLGIPLFLLFVGVAWWAVMLWALAPAARPQRVTDPDARFGRALLLTTGVVLLATVGFTNIETPRLWIPFVPLMLLGGLLQLRPLRNPGRGPLRLLAMLVVIHISCAALQWSVMDMREAETRIAERRFFG